MLNVLESIPECRSMIHLPLEERKVLEQERNKVKSGGERGGREEGREGGREERREGGREEGREGGRKERRKEGRNERTNDGMDGWLYAWIDGGMEETEKKKTASKKVVVDANLVNNIF